MFVPYFYTVISTLVAPTQQDLQTAAQLGQSPLWGLCAGPGYGLDNPTIERYFVAAYGIEFLLAAALMSILLVSRHTRVEEQNGRAELVRAAVVGRHAALTAALIVAAITNVVLAALVTVMMIGLGFAAGSSLLFGAGVAATGMAFAGLTAITVQVTEYPRAASGIAGAALAVAHVIRGIGDTIGEHAACCRGSRRWHGRSRHACS